MELYEAILSYNVLAVKNLIQEAGRQILQAKDRVRNCFIYILSSSPRRGGLLTVFHTVRRRRRRLRCRRRSYLFLR